MKTSAREKSGVEIGKRGGGVAEAMASAERK
jgi:hypothetical protein